MGKSKQQPKKKGGMGYSLLGLIVALAIILPASANRSFAGEFTHGWAKVPTQIVAGYTLSGGLNDPGEAVSLSLNNVLTVINENLEVPGYQLSWRGHRLVEVGALTGGYSGPQGRDASADTFDGGAFIGVGARLLEAVNANAIYMLDSRAKSNFKTFVGVDLAVMGPKLVSLTSAAWSKTGL